MKKQILSPGRSFMYGMLGANICNSALDLLVGKDRALHETDWLMISVCSLIIVADQLYCRRLKRRAKRVLEIMASYSNLN